VTSPDEFHRRVQSWSGVSLAILEIEARRPDHIDLAKSALDRGIPVMALTADSQYRQGIPGLPGMPVLVKPVPDETLSTAIFEFIGDPAIRTSDCQT